MIRYLRDEIDHLAELNKGISANPAVWAGCDVNYEQVKSLIDELEEQENKIEEAKALLSKLSSNARALQAKASSLGSKIESFVYAFHSEQKEKFIDYGMPATQTVKRREAPQKKLSVRIEDDTNGAGFIVSTQSDSCADLYEWHKGIAEDPSRTDVIPEMILVKTTRKVSFIDKDVTKGVRVFYKVRATNNKGNGPWSEAVSRVQ